MKKHLGFKILAGFMGVYHVGMGAFGIISGEMAARAAHALWHANVTVDPQFTYLCKFLGAYVIAFGLMLLLAASNPVRYASIAYVAVALAALRIFERLYFASDLKAAFGIGLDRTIVTVIIVTLLNGGLLLLKPREGESSGS